MFIVPRTCTRIDKDLVPRSSPIEEYRNSPAYVLLGEPGMGKTQAFMKESEQQENSIYITARDLIAFGAESEWRDKILFIDGLDEVRATSQNSIGPFDAIRSCLNKLGKPQFRLSCREADWLGSSDKEQLQKIAPDNNEILELHLDELIEDDITEILKNNYQDDVQSPSGFIEEVKSRGLFELIKNPQILDMLVSAITDSGQWPDSRESTFELACRRILIVEHNLEHSDAQDDQFQAIDKQLEAAGYLCTLLLLSDKTGFSLTTSSGSENYPVVNDLGYENIPLLKVVSKTKLFNTNDDHFNYIHRTVAEYLSAYYLKKQIEERGLPVARVLALITGKDGIAVTALRGLFAWLVTLCGKERTMLINRDPLGLVLYGDVKSFSVSDKSNILDALKEEADRYPYFRSGNWAEHPFGALCTSNMEPVFDRILKSSDRSDAHQALVDCVLDAMMHGECLTELIEFLPKIVRDTSWWSGLRREALHVFIKKNEDKKENDEQLMQLVEDINNNIIQDKDDDLLGVLLNELYPDVIKPAEIFDYLHTPKNPNYLGLYEYFWSMYLCELSSDAMLPELLDELVLRHVKLMTVLNQIHFRTMLGSLLKKSLESHGEIIPAKQLSDWLGLGLDEHGSMSLNHEDEIKQIRAWIGMHPEIQKSIIDLHVNECIESKNFDWCIHKALERLYQSELPKDYGVWCLNKAKQSNENIISKYFIQESVRTLFQEKGNEGLSLELLEQTAIESSRLETYIKEMLEGPIDRGDREFKKKLQERQEKELLQKQEYIQSVKDNIDAIRTGTADSGIFYNLGMAYYGRFIDFKGETPYERLIKYFEDEVLVDAILTGLTKCLERDDIPTVEEILQLNMKSKIYYLSFPIRAGLEIISRQESNKILQLSKEKASRFLAFYFADNYGEDVDWYWELVRECPEIVAEILSKYVLIALRARKQYVSHLYSLAFDEKYSDIARQVAIPLLNGFPTRCNSKQLGSLDELLKAALQYSEREQFRGLVKKKLNLRSMNTAQRAYWLAAAFVLSPDQYEKSLIEYVGENIRRVNYLSRFFTERSDQVSLTNEFPEFALALLIKLFGSSCSPRNWDDAGKRMTSVRSNAEYISNLINKLSMMSSDSATKAINGLIKEEKLSKWHVTLQGALYQQQANKREAEFSHPDIKQVSRTINNHAPANVADLAALVFQHIRDLATQIRNSDTDDYKQYWNMDYKNHNHIFIKRKHEDICRDAFLSDLKERLSILGVDAIPEGHYADDKRADIRVSYGGTGGFNVPIEIKCNDHKNIWYAIHEQLIAKYTRDPGAHGYGIYLVFWFGAEKTTPAPEGPRPKTPKELEARLKERLNSKEEHQQISICVIDCSVAD
jgi:hypothetical protein